MTEAQQQAREAREAILVAISKLKAAWKLEPDLKKSNRLHRLIEKLEDIVEVL